MEYDKIGVLYKTLINKQELTISTLIKQGLNQEDIEKMISQKILKRTDVEHLKLISIDKIRQYAVYLIITNSPIEANRCITLCYELEPNNRKIAMQYMLSKITKYKYEEAFQIFSKIEQEHPEVYEKDNNLYLYLLGNVTIFPPEYQKKIKKIKPQDILLIKGSNTKVENEIRTAIAKHKFKYAYQLINDRYSKEKNYSLKFEIIRILIIHAIETETKLKETLLTLTKQQKYEEIYEILNTLKSQRYLSDIELAILQITEGIINLTKFEMFPEPKRIEATNIYEAIKNSDYKQAAEINKEFLDYTQQDSSNNIIYLLLTSINKLIEIKLEEYQNYQLISSPKETWNQNKESTKDENDEILKEVEDIAYYIAEQKITLDTARKRIGIIPEQMLLIKLVYTRDYYASEMYLEGDALIKEVEQSNNLTPRVIKILQKIKESKFTSNNDTKHKKLIYTPQ